MNPLNDQQTISLDRLAVFVVGPGTGEGIAVALPGGGWLLIDGSRTAGSSGKSPSLLEIWNTWKRSQDDNVLWMILTHPHEDHVAGFAAVLDAVQPENVGMAGPPSPQKSLFDELSRFAGHEGVTENALLRGQLLAAATGIRSWEVKTGNSLAALHAGATLLSGDVVVEVVAPSSNSAQQVLGIG